MLLSILGIVLGVVGVIGCIVPGLPGPPVSWLGLLCVYLSESADPVSSRFLLIALGVVTLVTVLDYVLPARLTRSFGGHKAASTGAMLGLFAGMFFTPVGIIGGSLLGAFLGELFFEDGGVWSSFKASVGAFLGFILTTGVKLACCGVMLYDIVQFAL